MTMAALCMQSAVLGFGVFRVLERYGITSGLSIGENVILQTTSVATATMPLAAGKPSVFFIGYPAKSLTCAAEVLRNPCSICMPARTHVAHTQSASLNIIDQKTVMEQSRFSKDCRFA